MNKSQSKYYHTACLMDQALLQLLDKKEFQYITVKEICEKAGVNRSTFYLHYETMSDLLAESIEYLISDLRNRYPQEDLLKTETSSLEELYLFTPRYSIPYLQFIKEYKKAFMAAVSQPNLFGTHNTFQTMYQKLFEPILARHHVPSAERRYMVQFFMSGIHAMIVEWIKGGCQDDITFIADLIVKCVNHSRG